MANICENEFYFSCESNLDYWEKKISDFVLDHEGNIDYTDPCGEGGIIEGYFYSKWTFPNEDFEELIPDVSQDIDEIYFRCLSKEYGCCYIAMNIYSNGKWEEEQSFDF